MMDFTKIINVLVEERMQEMQALQDIVKKFIQWMETYNFTCVTETAGESCSYTLNNYKVTLVINNCRNKCHLLVYRECKGRRGDIMIGDYTITDKGVIVTQDSLVGSWKEFTDFMKSGFAVCYGTERGQWPRL